MNKEEIINDIKIDTSESILSALKKMDKSFKRLLLMFNGEQFVNVLSIGDIQRAIIRNVSLANPVFSIMRKNTEVANIYDDFQVVKQRMLQHRIECMPVIDENKNLVS